MFEHTNEMPFSTSLIELQFLRWAACRDVKFSAFVSFRLVDELTALFVKRKPRNVHWTMSHGQLEFTIPDTRTVGENFDVMHIRASRLFLRTYTTLHNTEMIQLKPVASSGFGANGHEARRQRCRKIGWWVLESTAD